MRIGEITDTLVTIYNNEATRARTVYLEGPSGIGKSEAVRTVVERLAADGKGEVGLYDLRLSTSDPTDFGLVMPVDGELVRQKPAFISYMERFDRGVLFLDEITSAPPAVQAPAYQVTLDRACNGFSVPDGWMVVAAGNAQTDRGVTYTMAAPLVSRMTTISVDTHLDDVMAYAINKGVNPLIIAFLRERPDLLHKFDGSAYTGRQFPTPRSWFAVSDKLDLDVPREMRLELITGDVGDEAGIAFEEFTRVWELMPSLEAIMTDPDQVEVPDRLDVRYCVTMGLATRIDGENFGTAWRFLKRMPREFQALCVKLAVKAGKEVSMSPAFSEWIAENSDAYSSLL